LVQAPGATLHRGAFATASGRFACLAPSPRRVFVFAEDAELAGVFVPFGQSVMHIAFGASLLAGFLLMEGFQAICATQ